MLSCGTGTNSDRMVQETSKGLKTADYYYDLPEELIAQDPLTDRSASRLLVLHRETGRTEHRHFRDILEYLEPGDTLVLNDTRVIPARLIGERLSRQEPEITGSEAEVLLLKRLSADTWETIVRPGKKLKAGDRIVFGKSGENGAEPMMRAEITRVLEDGNRIVRFSYEGIWEEVLDRLGEMPLPPYIRHKLQDKNRYQTVYAKYEGSAAAPTAGLHFTKELLSEAERKGVNLAFVTLHVGLGTFRPVKVEDVTSHRMHTEWYRMTAETAQLINRTKKEGHRVICVGTTSCRTVETVAAETEAQGVLQDIVRPSEGDTSIFIYPGFSFRVMDGLITNFHLPESTLLMLVSAFAGRERMLEVYREAVRERYRFFSFGDAMLII